MQTERRRWAVWAAGSVRPRHAGQQLSAHALPFPENTGTATLQTGAPSASLGTGERSGLRRARLCNLGFSGGSEAGVWQAQDSAGQWSGAAVTARSAPRTFGPRSPHTKHGLICDQDSQRPGTGQPGCHPAVGSAEQFLGSAGSGGRLAGAWPTSVPGARRGKRRNVGNLGIGPAAGAGAVSLPALAPEPSAPLGPAGRSAELRWSLQGGTGTGDTNLTSQSLGQQVTLAQEVS